MTDLNKTTDPWSNLVEGIASIANAIPFPKGYNHEAVEYNGGKLTVFHDLAYTYEVWVSLQKPDHPQNFALFLRQSRSGTPQLTRVQFYLPDDESWKISSTIIRKEHNDRAYEWERSSAQEDQARIVAARLTAPHHTVAVYRFRFSRRVEGGHPEDLAALPPTLSRLMRRKSIFGEIVPPDRISYTGVAGEIIKRSGFNTFIARMKESLVVPS